MLAAHAPADDFTCSTAGPGPRAATLSSVPPAIGIKRILWTRLAFANETNQPAGEAEIQAGLETANATLIRVSNTNVSLVWTVTPVLRLPNDIDYYSTRSGDLLMHGRKAAADAGFNWWQSFDIQVLGPRPVPGWTTGFTAISSRWMYCSRPIPGVIVHELGHCFGLSHANAWQARGPNFFAKSSPPFPSNFQTLTQTFPINPGSAFVHEGVMFPGQSVEYGDPFDIMGNADANSDFNAAEKLRLGWIPSTNVITVTHPGTYRIAPSHALRLAPMIVGRHPDSLPCQYWIEPAADGIFLRWADTNILRETLFIDATPGARYWPLRTTFQDGVLKVGSTFEDPGLGLWITPSATNASGTNRWVDVAISKTRPTNLPSSAPSTGYLLTGRVVDTSANPLANVLINNGLAPGNYQYASTRSDENGNFSLALLAPGTFVPTVSLYGYRLASPAMNTSATVPGSIDFILKPLPRVSIATQDTVAPGQTATFSFSRTGANDEPLQIAIQFSGGADLAFLPRELTITIPDGEASAQLNVLMRTNSLAEPASLTLHAINANQFQREAITFYYPGWEMRTVAGITNWFQTDPPYATLADASATIRVESADSLRLAVTEPDRLSVYGPFGRVFRVEISSDLLSWKAFATGAIQESSTHIPLPSLAGNERYFFRAFLLP